VVPDVPEPIRVMGLCTPAAHCNVTEADAGGDQAERSACDLNQDGTVNIPDVQLSTDMVLAPTNGTAPYGLP